MIDMVMIPIIISIVHLRHIDIIINETPIDYKFLRFLSNKTKSIKVHIEFITKDEE